MNKKDTLRVAAIVKAVETGLRDEIRREVDRAISERMVELIRYFAIREVHEQMETRNE